VRSARAIPPSNLRAFATKTKSHSLRARALVKPRIFLLAAVTVAACVSRQPDLTELGPPLKPCPPTPNCVTTESNDTVRAVSVIPFADSPDMAQARARKALLSESRTQIVVERPGYLHAESRSLIFRFVDDVQIVVDSNSNVFRMRSASRVGHSDFGVNRKRLQRISARLRSVSIADSVISKPASGA